MVLSSTNTYGFIAANALLGLSPRNQRWLDARAIYASTYAKDRLPWLPDHDAQGEYILASQRDPQLYVGLAQANVDELTNMLTGAGQLPSIAYIPSTADAPELDQTQQEDLQRLIDFLWQDLKLTRTLENPAHDAAVGGTAAMGVTRRITPDGPVYEPLRIAPEWAHTVTAAQVKTQRARHLAQDLLATTKDPVIDKHITQDEQGPHFIAPEDIPSDQLVYVRYQKRSADISDIPGRYSQATTHWTRTDYLLDAIVPFEPINYIGALSTHPPQWRIEGAVDPHNWGIVPIAWSKNGRSEPEDVDGTPMIADALASQNEAADRAASFMHDSVNRNCDPGFLIVDGVDAQKEQRVLNAINSGNIPGAYTMPTVGGNSVMIRTSGTSGQQATARLIETSGEPARSAVEHVQQIRNYASKTTGIVDHDPQLSMSIPSGVALERASAPTVAQISRYRLTLTDLIGGLFEIGYTIMRAEGQITSEVPTENIVTKWPPSFPRTAQDIKHQADALSIAVNNHLLSRKTASTMFANYLELPNPDEEADQAVSEAEEADKKAEADAEAAAERLGGPQDPMPPEAREGQDLPVDESTDPDPGSDE